MTITTANDMDRWLLATREADEAFRAMEAKWGVARLERLVSRGTLENYRRGWLAYREALAGDIDALERIAPKMVQALGYMDAEATAAGHQPLSVDRWEAATNDGRVLVLVRTQAEAHAIAREPRGDGEPERIVWTLDECARVLPTYNAVDAIKAAFPGAEVARVSGVQSREGAVHDWVTNDLLFDVLGSEAT